MVMVVAADEDVLSNKFVIYRWAPRESDSIRNDNKNGTFVVLACMHAYAHMSHIISKRA